MARRNVKNGIQNKAVREGWMIIGKNDGITRPHVKSMKLGKNQFAKDYQIEINEKGLGRRIIYGRDATIQAGIGLPNMVKEIRRQKEVGKIGPGTKKGALHSSGLAYLKSQEEMGSTGHRKLRTIYETENKKVLTDDAANESGTVLINKHFKEYGLTPDAIRDSAHMAIGAGMSKREFLSVIEKNSIGKFRNPKLGGLERTLTIAGRRYDTAKRTNREVDWNAL